MECQVVLVESAEQDGAEVEGPDAIVDLLESYVLLDDAGADVDPALLPADAAVSADAADLEVAGVLQRREPLGIGARGRLVEGGRGLVAEPLVGPLGIELLAEGVEETLLGSGIGGRRPGRLGLEGLVHPLVAAVLLGVGGLDQLGTDAQADPPDGESGETADRRGGAERGAVIGAEAHAIMNSWLAAASVVARLWAGLPVALGSLIIYAVVSRRRAGSRGGKGLERPSIRSGAAGHHAA